MIYDLIRVRVQGSVNRQLTSVPYICQFEAPRTSRNKFHDWLENTIEQTTETKGNNPETIEVRVFKNEWN